MQPEFDTRNLQGVSKLRSLDNDFKFFNDIISDDSCPEFIGYNRKIQSATEKTQLFQLRFSNVSLN